VKPIEPPGWARPKGYAHAIAASGTTLFVSGQIGREEGGAFAGDLPSQVRLALRNVAAILAAAGARPEHVVRLTWYVLDKRDYLASAKPIGAAYREVMGKHFPAMSVVEVAGLVEDRALVEIEATAVLPG